MFLVDSFFKYLNYNKKRTDFQFYDDWLTLLGLINCLFFNCRTSWRVMKNGNMQLIIAKILNIKKVVVWIFGL